MADTSERIIILSAFLLVAILVQSTQMYQMEPIKEKEDTILTVKDMQIQIATSRDNYTLGEGFTATVYLVNTRSEEVQMEPITGLNIEGRSVNGTGGLATFIDWFPAAGTVTTLPANSKKKLVDKYFTPEQTGEFIITCLGEKKTVLIIEPIAEHVDEKYNISREEAMDIAVEAAGSIEWVDIDAKIWYMDELLDDTPIEKHVWVVSLYLTPRKANSGSFLRVIVDPYNGTVFESERIGWMSTP